MKNKKFIFSNKKFNNLANLIVNKSYSNVFITLTDLRNKVIVCKSSGSCGVGTSKKSKKSPQAVENIVKALISFFELHGLKYFNIILKKRFSSHVVILVKELSDKGYKLISFLNRYKVSHNGMRGRKIRRI